MGDSNHMEYQVSALNDLIRINTDRIVGYKKLTTITIDDDLDGLCSQFIYQSRQYIDELCQYIKILGGQPADGHFLPGKFYHAWTDYNMSITRQTRQTMLDFCENSEDVAKSAYRKVLDDNDVAEKNIRTLKLLARHLDELGLSGKLINDLRDDATTSI